MFTDRFINKDEAASSGARGCILDAARRRFARDGYAATPVQRIAADAGVTKPMVYYYFGSKECLFTEVVAVARRDVAERLREAVSGDAPARLKLERLVRGHLELSRDHAESLRLIEATAVSGGGAPPADIEPIVALYDATVGKVLAEGIARREIRPMDRELLVALFRGVLFAAGRGAGVDSPAAIAPDLAVRIVDLLWHGVAVPGAGRS